MNLFISDQIENENLSPEDFIKFVIDENKSKPNRIKGLFTFDPINIFLKRNNEK